MFYLDIYLGGKNNLLLTEKPICPKLFTEEAERLVVVALVRKKANLKISLSKGLETIGSLPKSLKSIRSLPKSFKPGGEGSPVAGCNTQDLDWGSYVQTVPSSQAQRSWVLLIKLIFNCEHLKKFIHLEIEAQVFQSQKVQPVCEDSELFLEENNF